MRARPATARPAGPDTTMNVPADPLQDRVPPTAEFTIAWITYACFYLGVLMWWPSVIGLIVSYVRRDQVEAGFIASHYRWLIGTFWWATLGWIASMVLLVSGAWPIVRDVLRSARRSGDDWEVDALVQIDWSSIFAAAGLATVGGIGILCVYLWLLYRLIRGSLRLANARPAP